MPDDGKIQLSPPHQVGAFAILDRLGYGRPSRPRRAAAPRSHQAAATLPISARHKGVALSLAHADGSNAHVLHDPYPYGYASGCWSDLAGIPDTPAWSLDGRWIAVECSGSSGSSTIINQLELVNTSNGHTRDLGAPTGTTGPSGLSWLPDGNGILETIEMTLDVVLATGPVKTP